MIRRSFLFVLLVGLTASADTVHLKNGRTLEGKILAEEEGRIRIRLPGGEAVVDRADIVRIEYGPSPEEVLAERRKTLDVRDAAAVLALAQWAAERGLAADAVDIARLGESDGCRRFVLDRIEPDVRRRSTEIADHVRLGLTGRARRAADEAVRLYPEVADRIRALLPADPVRRTRYEGVLEVKDAERLRRVEQAVNAWFDRGEELRVEAPIEEVLAAIRRGAAVPADPPTGLVIRRTSGGVPYVLRTPSKIDPERPLRLLITLHGTGQTGRHALALWGRSLLDEEDLLVAAPDAGHLGWGNSLAGHEQILSVLRDVCSAYPVDLDRVFVDGSSLGAHGAFFLAMHHPDRWAGIAPRVGSARYLNIRTRSGHPDVSAAPAPLDNLAHLPVFLIAGARDPQTAIEDVRVTAQRLTYLGGPLVYREHADGGHDWFSEEDADVADFLRAHRRNPYPARVRFASRESAFARSYWIEVLETTRVLRTEIAHIDLRGEEIEARKEYDRPVTVEGFAEREAQRVTLKTSGVKRLAVWLSDALVDLDRPIRVVANGRTVFEGKVERSIRLALDDCRARKDRGLPYPARLEVTIR